MRWCCNCFNMISVSICFHYEFGIPLQILTDPLLLVFVWSFMNTICLSLAAMTPGTIADHWGPFWTIWVWNCEPRGFVLCNKWRDHPLRLSGTRAAYDFMETSYDNGWLVCVVLNRSGEWMTTTSVSGVAQKLCGKGNCLFVKCHSRNQVHWQFWRVNLFFLCKFLLFPIDVHFLLTINVRIKSTVIFPQCRWL